jgi:tetratricopeptide (TPR) repeat protein
MIVWALPLLVILSQGASPPTAIATARDQIRQGNCPAAVDTLTALLHSAPKPGDVPYQLLAVCYERLGQLNRGIDTLRDGLRGNPDSAALGRTLGELLFHQDSSNPEAGQLLAAAVKTAPRDPEARHYYAQWAALNNRDQICADQEQTAIRLSGLNNLALIQMYTLQGICLNHLDKAAAAKFAFEKAFAIDLRQRPFNPAIAYQYVQFLTGRGQSEDAKKVVAEILRRSPQFGPAHLEAAKSFDHDRQAEKAIQEAKAALLGEGDDEDNIRAAHVLLAKNYFILERTTEAEAEQEWVESHASAPKP